MSLEGKKLSRVLTLNKHTFHPCIKGKFPEGGGEGKNNRTFAFWGRILGPATVFFGFLEGFWTIF